MTSTRGTSLVGRSLDTVTGALDTVRRSALDRALDPRNAAKGDWRGLSWTELRALLWEEVCELCEAIDRHEPTSRIVAEAGDVVWCVAMVVDAIRYRQSEGVE